MSVLVVVAVSRLWKWAIFFFSSSVSSDCHHLAHLERALINFRQRPLVVHDREFGELIVVDLGHVRHEIDDPGQLLRLGIELGRVGGTQRLELGGGQPLGRCRGGRCGSTAGGGGIGPAGGGQHRIHGRLLDDAGEALGKELEVRRVDGNARRAPAEEIVGGLRNGIVAIRQHVIELAHDRIRDHMRCNFRHRLSPSPDFPGSPRENAWWS